MSHTRTIILRMLASGLAGLLTLTLLAACGKRGPLYLPDDKAGAPEQNASEQQTPQEKASEDEQDPPPSTAPGY